MVVTLGKKVWKMNQERYNSLLALGSEQVPFGVYAIEKDGQVEMRLDHCKSITQLKELIQQFKKAGYKVYANER